jgi:hypothetical protein
VLRKFIALAFLGFWLLPVQYGLLKNDDLTNYSTTQKLLRSAPLNVVVAIRAPEYKEKASSHSISARYITINPAISRISSQWNKKMPQQSEGNREIYKLNCAFLI